MPLSEAAVHDFVASLCRGELYPKAFVEEHAATVEWGRAWEGHLYLALDAAGASEFVSRLPRGVRTSVGEGGKQLSGGQRQRRAGSSRLGVQWGSQWGVGRGPVREGLSAHVGLLGRSEREQTQQTRSAGRCAHLRPSAQP